MDIEPIADFDGVDLAGVDGYSFTLAQVRWLVSELKVERARVQEAIRLGQKRAEAMQDLALEAYDEAHVAYLPDATREIRKCFVERMGIRAARAATKPASFMSGDVGRFGSSPQPYPSTHGRTEYREGDEIVTVDGMRGTITGPPDARHPHSARVALDDGGLYDIGLSLLRRVP